MSLRPIKAMSKVGIEAADLSAAVRPVFEQVNPSKLMVDETYQRNLSEKSVKLIRRIVSSWNWAKFKPPIVVETDAGMLVIDGQHTAIAAATHGGLKTIPVMIVHAPETIDQAAAFIGQNRDRVAMTAMQMHHAAVVAGDESAVRVQRIAEAAGIRILRSPPGNAAYKVNDTVSIEAIRSVIRRHGEDKALQLLKALAEANLAPIGLSHVRAAEALMFEPEFGGVRATSVTSALLAMGHLADQEAKVFAATHGVKQHWRALAAVLNRKIAHGRRRAA